MITKGSAYHIFVDILYQCSNAKMFKSLAVLTHLRTRIFTKSTWVLVGPSGWDVLHMRPWVENLPSSIPRLSRIYDPSINRISSQHGDIQSMKSKPSIYTFMRRHFLHTYPPPSGRTLLFLFVNLNEPHRLTYATTLLVTVEIRYTCTGS
jgi:hypothetical protein